MACLCTDHALDIQLSHARTVNLIGNSFGIANERQHEVAARQPRGLSYDVSAVEFDRWVIPPAVTAALFALVAISPPIGDATTHQGLRVEVALPTEAERPVLVRASIEDNAVAQLSAPRDAWMTLRDPSGAELDRARLETAPGLNHATGRLNARGRGPYTLDVHHEAMRASVRFGLPAAQTHAPTAPPPVGSLEVLAASGRLIPESAGTVLVRAPGARRVTLTSEIEGVTIEPPSADVGACDIASFRVTVAGLGAPVIVVAQRPDGVEVRTQTRLPLTPGGVSVHPEGDSVLVRGANAGSTVFLVGGDAQGARWWASRNLVRDGDSAAARFELTPDVRWVSATLAPSLVDPESAAVWTSPPPEALETCATNDTARAWFAARTPRPAMPALRLAWDGAARATRAHRLRVMRVRRLALGCLAASILIEIALVLGFGMRDTEPTLHEITRRRRERVAVLFAGVAVLLVLGFALGLSAILGAEAPASPVDYPQ